MQTSPTMEKELIQTLGKMTYGIYVLTSYYKQKINGMIASWVSQVSYDPPMIMVAIHPNRYSHHLIKKGSYFALHVLAKTQTDLLKRFKGSDPSAKFDDIQWTRGKTGCPVLGECVAYMECEVETSYSPGNHTLFIGNVRCGRVISKGDPLCTFDLGGVYLGKD
jgi:flavin reductase (DIM6/NTAB) family NADH-FMN oxidoreductase RutF